jgi:phytoene dehydrogenase-like protein
MDFLMKRIDLPVIIVGAGLAGLCCARKLYEDGISFLLLEASDRIGGRIKTDRVDGFLLDHGFQVLQDAYLEAQKQLDYQALDLHRFARGAIVRANGKFHHIADPRRLPKYLRETLAAPIGTFSDRLRMMRLSRKVSRGSIAALFQQSESLTIDFLRSEGFSESMIQRFFIPFFSGVCLDPEIRVASLFFQFVFRMFTEGDATLPARGMGAIPMQLSSGLPDGSVRTGVRVTSVNNGRVGLESGDEIEARTVVIATEGPETARLLGATETIFSRQVTCLYFAAKKPPIHDPFLVLNGEQTDPVHSLCVPSLVSPTYAPPGQSLICVVVLGNPEISDQTLENAVRGLLTEWYGPKVDDWRLLKVFRIRHALTQQSPPMPDPTVPSRQIKQGIFVCGEYQNAPSIQWAMASGRQAAEALIAELKK